MSLSKQNNDEWTFKYLAHFYESNSQLQLFFYDSPFYKLKETAYSASPITMRKGISFPGYQESYERLNLLFYIGIPRTIILFHYWSQSIFQILAMLSGCFMFFKLVNLLPPIAEEPTLTFLNVAISIFGSFRVMGKLFRYVIQNSPYSWDAAGVAIKIGLIEEIDNIMSPPYNTHKSNTRLSQSASPDYFSSATSKTAASSTILFMSPFTDDQKLLPDEHKSTQKRKHQSAASQSFLSLKNTTRVKITWEDAAIPSLEGIVVEVGKGKHDIDIIPTPGFSRGWSTNRSLNASCKHHFFYQPENKNSTQDPIASEFSNLISLAHVVPPTAHAGLVPLQPNDSDFCGARYKVKAFLQSIATMRVGLFFASRSKPLEVIGDSKSPLPESLKNEKFHLHIPGKPKRTH